MRILMMSKLSPEYDRIKQWLVQLDCDVVTAPTLKSSLKVLESDPSIDLVMVEGCADCELTEKFLTNLKNDHRLNFLPRIVVGVELDAATVRKYIELGVQDVILLPTTKETLEAKIYIAAKKGKPSILVIDDEPAIVEILADFLTLERCRPYTAGSAEEAVDIIAENHIDLIISDIILPARSGLQLMVEVKEKYNGLPVILITGHSGKFTPKDVVAMGADGYFAKPFHNMDLIYTLRRVLSSRAGYEASHTIVHSSA
ncbi:MAG: response regulator [candidate division Zixibacteria bacterium]|nr:response regulator [candidate division Zixibacteria bacterium]